jgi:shikimate kinase
MGKQSASLSHAGSLPAGSLPARSLAQKQLSPNRVILVGFMGAGKTSVGKELARLLGWSFEDLDDRIQAREGRTIEEIFRESGEAEFRRCEHMALRDLLAELKPGCRIIALGGGAFAQPENASLVRDSNIPSVFLDAPIQELFRRCQEQELKRPLRQDEAQFRKLYDIRRPLYLAATHHVETNGKPIAETAAEIAGALGIAPSK